MNLSADAKQLQSTIDRYWQGVCECYRSDLIKLIEQTCIENGWEFLWMGEVPQFVLAGMIAEVKNDLTATLLKLVTDLKLQSSRFDSRSQTWIGGPPNIRPYEAK